MLEHILTEGAESRENAVGTAEVRDGDHREERPARRIAGRSVAAWDAEAQQWYEGERKAEAERESRRSRGRLSSLEGTSETTEGAGVRWDQVVGHKMLTVHCLRCGQPFKVKMRCGDRTCRECRSADYWRMLKGYQKPVRAMKAPKLMTTTIENVPTLTRGDVDRMLKGHKRLLDRVYYKAKVRGGLRAIEVKYVEPGIVKNGHVCVGGWNVHIHDLIDADYIPQAKLSKDAVRAGLGPICDIQDARKHGGIEGTLRYILKYLTKGPEVAGREDEYNEIMARRRLIQPFGTIFDQLKIEGPVLLCRECAGDGFMSEFELRRLRSAAERAYGKGGSKVRGEPRSSIVGQTVKLVASERG